MWGETFYNRTGFSVVKLNGQTLYAAKESFESYPWDECVRDQINRYGSKEVAEKVCGMIRSKYG
jgi:hypothetical protein